MSNIIKYLLFVLGGVALLAIGFYGGTQYQPPGKPTIDAAALETQIAECSDLTTSKLTYTGYVHFREGEIPLLTKKEFSMVYVAEARAGVDLSLATVNVSEDEITVELPKAETQGITIDPSSLEFFDTKRALFNWQNRTDAAEALLAAEEDVKDRIDQTKLIEEADKQARVLVEELLVPFTEEPYAYTVSIK